MRTLTLLLLLAIGTTFAQAQSLKLRRFTTTAYTNTNTPAMGEPVYDEAAKALRIGDGSTAGGNLIGDMKWVEVTPDGTNSVIDLAVGRNFYYTLSTSNYIIFSNLVNGASGTLWINAAGTARDINFSSSYDNFSTNDIAPVFSLTNRCVIAYKIGWGTDSTNVMLGIKRK